VRAHKPTVAEPVFSTRAARAAKPTTPEPLRPARAEKPTTPEPLRAQRVAAKPEEVSPVPSADDTDD
jgi:hypothetical protein